MSAIKKRGVLFLVFASSLISVFWMLSIHNTFMFDDSTLLSDASLSSYDALFSFYPTSVYLDRPIRNILIKFLYDMFGKDYTLQHAALVITHLLNVLLVFVVAKRVFALKEDLNSDRIFVAACITALVFGAWPNSLMAVQWISGNNDLMGTTFALMSFYFFLRSIQEEQYKGQNICFELFFFFLAIRSKEMFYPLPVVFVLCEVYIMLQKKEKIKFSLGSIAGLIVMVVFFAGIIYCKFQDQSITVASTEPYYQSFNPFSMLIVLFKYCMLYIDLWHGNMSYTPSVFGIIGLIFILLWFGCSIVFTVKKHFELLFCYIAIGCSIVMVLPMVNQIHRLYLYFPAFFIGVFVATSILILFKHYERLLLIISACCILANNAPGPMNLREFWKSIGDMENSVYTQLEQITKPIEESKVYVFLEDTNEYTPFFYGPGAVVKLVYQDNTLQPSIHTLREKVDFQAPYLVLSYIDGKIEEVERNETRSLKILDVYSSLQEDGSMVVGITPDVIKSTLKVYVDGQEVPVILGTDFISTTITNEQLSGKTSVNIQICDEYETYSDIWSITLK